MWYNGASGNDFSGVPKKTTGATVNWMTNQFPPNLLLFDSRTLSADVRWVSPVSGTYDVRGFFQRLDTTSSQPATVGIVEDGTRTLFSAANFITFNAQEPFNLKNLFLPAGTTLDFYQFNTGSPAYTGGGVEATITRVPEPAAEIYDAVNDFSLAGNPNGAWSYGALSSTSGGTFTLFKQKQTNSISSGDLMWYNGASGTDFSGVHKNMKGAKVNWMTNRFPPNLLLFDSRRSLIADVRWVSPVSGRYNVSGFFQRLDTTSSQPATVGVVKDGTQTLFSAANFITFNARKPFNLKNLFLPAGTTLDFYQFNTGSPAYTGGGVEATITRVPEPAAAR